MESLGEKLKEARISQNTTVDQVARDTMISKRYIEALEEENFDAFPGETYLIGFLRNYAEYLDLDPNALITLYKNAKLQEQPIPMEELIHGKKKVPPVTIGLGAVAVVAVLAVGSYFIFQGIKGKQPEPAVQEGLPVSSGEDTEYFFTAETDTQWFGKGARISIPVGDRAYKVSVESIEKNLILNVPRGTMKMEVGESRFLDLNLDNKNDIKIFFNDIDNEAKRVNLQLTRASLLLAEDRKETARAESTGVEEAKEPESTEAAETAETAETTETTESPDSAGDTAEVTSVETTDAESEEAVPALEAVRKDDRLIILEADFPRIFEVEIAFRGNCLLRYLLDGETRDQRFFQKSEEFLLDNVRREVVLWISNAGALTTKIENREVKFGRQGQVVTKLIHWVKAEEGGKYRLEVVSSY
jgi:cytoskeletal protein RodZ